MDDATAAPAASAPTPEPVEQVAKEILFVPVMACCANGHRFSKRTTTTAPSADQIREAAEADNNYWDVDDIVNVMEALTTTTYICDVCDRCGLTVGLV